MAVLSWVAGGGRGNVSPLATAKAYGNTSGSAPKSESKFKQNAPSAKKTDKKPEKSSARKDDNKDRDGDKGRKDNSRDRDDNDERDDDRDRDRDEDQPPETGRAGETALGALDPVKGLRGRNIALAEHTIDGVAGESIATSGGHQYPPMPENPQFDPGRRKNDSEWKLLEHLVEDLDLSW